MLTLMTVLLLQQPTLTQTASQSLTLRERTTLGVSQTGKYLVIGEPDRLEIRDATTLAPVTEIVRRWTAFGFDERDERFLVVGDGVTRYLVRDWTVQFQGEIERAKFAEGRQPPRTLRPGQALVLPDLDFYFIDKERGLSLATVAGGTVEIKGESLKTEDGLDQVLGTAPGAMLVSSRGGNLRISLRGKVYNLVGCDQPILGGSTGNQAVAVGLSSEAFYSTASWKVIESRSGLTNHCATLDAKAGRVFVGDPEGLRGWTFKNFKGQERYKELESPVLQVLAVPDQRLLFTVERVWLRRWTISD